MPSGNTPQALKDPAIPSWLAPEKRELQERARQNVLRRMESREELRQELRGRHYIQQVHAIIDTLLSGYETVNGQKVELTQKRANQLAKAGEHAHKLLNKLLPDTKAVEIDESPEKSARDAVQMSTQELLALARSQLPAIEAECTEVKPEPAPQPAPARRHHGFEHWPFG